MTQIALDETRLREIRDLISSGSSISFTSHRAHESVAGMADALLAILKLHPKVDNPRHGCCGGKKLCSGHAPECGGLDHLSSLRPHWPCATLRAMGIPQLDLPECGATFHTGERRGFDYNADRRAKLREIHGVTLLVCTRRLGHGHVHEMRKGGKTIATWFPDDRND